MISRRCIRAPRTFLGIVSLLLCSMISGYPQQSGPVESPKLQQKHHFIVEGAVRTLGMYKFEREVSLLELLTSTGGLNETHGPSAYVFRPIRGRTEGKIEGHSYVCVASSERTAEQSSCVFPNVEYELLRIHINSIFNTKFSEPIRFKSGCIINIPHGSAFFVTGEVRTRGQFSYQVGLTLRQAIFLAGNRLEGASSYAVIYSIDPETRIKKETIVDLDAVMSGAEKDLKIFPDDIINVPDNKLGLNPVIPLNHLVDISHHKLSR
jgi:protein involved in polysaccharide export with SLBB domain